MNNEGAEIIASAADYTLLGSADEYNRYFDLLNRVLDKLGRCYRSTADGSSHEAAEATRFLQRLLYTTAALRMKSAQLTGDRRPLWIDVTESGFPNSAEISNLEVDLKQRADRLGMLLSEESLKNSLLDHLFEFHSDPAELLRDLASRAYFEMLDLDRLFLPYNKGVLLRQPPAGHAARGYLCTWACYDFKTNCPSIYLLTFDQDSSSEPLETNADNLQRFQEVIRLEGSRVPPIGVLALAIDDALEDIHPKVLKRISIGPLYAQLIFEQALDGPADSRETALRELFSRCSRNASDFMLFFHDEIVVSERQEHNRSLFSPLGRVREVFAIRELDPECYTRRASFIHRYVLLPHYIQQQLSAADRAAVPELARARQFTYDQAGEVHGI